MGAVKFCFRRGRVCFKKHFFYYVDRRKNIIGDVRIWTKDISHAKVMLLHWAFSSIMAEVENSFLKAFFAKYIEDMNEGFNGFELTKKRSWRYPVKTINDADYADDIVTLANTPNQAETLLHSLERAAADIGLYVNAHKMEYISYNQTGDTSTLDGNSLKLGHKSTYPGGSVSSIEKDIETRPTKAWTAIDRLSIIWKSGLTYKMKRSFFQAAAVLKLLYGCTTWTLTKWLEKLDGN